MFRSANIVSVLTAPLISVNISPYLTIEPVICITPTLLFIYALSDSLFESLSPLRAKYSLFPVAIFSADSMSLDFLVAILMMFSKFSLEVSQTLS